LGSDIEILGSEENPGATFDILAVQFDQMTVTPIGQTQNMIAEVADGVEIVALSSLPMKVRRKTPGMIKNVHYSGAIDGIRDTFPETMYIRGPLEDCSIRAHVKNTYGALIDVVGHHTKNLTLQLSNDPSRLPSVSTMQFQTGEGIHVSGRITCGTGAPGIYNKGGTDLNINAEINNIPAGEYGFRTDFGRSRFRGRLVEAANAVGTARGLSCATGARLILDGADFTGLSNTARAQLLSVGVGGYVAAAPCFGLPVSGLSGVQTLSVTPYAPDPLYVAMNYNIVPAASSLITVSIDGAVQISNLATAVSIMVGANQVLSVSWTGATAPTVRRSPIRDVA
jgi:hypothetical protein